MVYFDDLIDPFFVEIGSHYKDLTKFQQGQVFFAPVPYSDEQRQYWRPTNYDTLTKTEAADFTIVNSASDLFHRPLPLRIPKLETNEEFMVTRVKRRPVVLLARAGSGILGKQARHHLVIPRFGAVKESGHAKISADIVNRIRTLEFPDVLFTPSHTPLLSKDGFLASHLIHAVPLSHLEPVNLSLSPLALAALVGQVKHRCFGVCEGNYAEWREMLMNPTT